MQDILDNYKSQQSVKRGFRFLKSPDFLTASLFLKTPERIEALLMVMTCCLMIYAALEHLIRRELVAKEMFFPDMKKKPTQNPIAKWVFWCCHGVHELNVDATVKVVINITARQRIILDCLGERYWGIYLPLDYSKIIQPTFRSHFQLVAEFHFRAAPECEIDQTLGLIN